MSNYNKDMKTTHIVSQISRIRNKANAFILYSLAQEGITELVPSHGDILAVLFKEGEVTMNDLAEAIHRTKPTVTILVKKLVTLGLVTRAKSPEDARITFITLTPKGKQFKNTFEQVSHALTTKLLKGVSASEQQQLEALLCKVEANL